MVQDSSISALLQQIKEEVRALRLDDTGTLDRLLKRVHMLLRNSGLHETYLASLNNIRFHPISSPSSSEINYKRWESGKGQLMNLIDTALEEIALIGSLSSAEASGQSSDRRKPTGRKVFIVHGRDERLKQQVARTLERLDLEPIILHEQPNKGRTIIEKFEDYADVPFAVVLLTPDDMGYLHGADTTTARPRARQNVVMELGFFLGMLGRNYVAALLSGDETFETPSDYEGVTYIPVDAGGRWQFDLVKELNAAGIDVDANRIT